MSTEDKNKKNEGLSTTSIILIVLASLIFVIGVGAVYRWYKSGGTGATTRRMDVVTDYT